MNQQRRDLTAVEAAVFQTGKEFFSAHLSRAHAISPNMSGIYAAGTLAALKCFFMEVLGQDKAYDILQTAADQVIEIANEIEKLEKESKRS